MTQPRVFSRRLGALGLLTGAGLALVGCAESSGEPITIVGSSTVFPFAQKVAQDTASAHSGFTAPIIQSSGSTEGIEAFCKGEGPGTPDIVNASRRMSLAEFQNCQAAGVAGIMEIKVGRDGVVFASAKDTGIDPALTSPAIYRALAANPFGEEQAAIRWADVDGDLPNEEILVYGPSATSGTRDALLDLVMMPACRAEPAMEALQQSDPEAFERVCHTLRDDRAYVLQGERDELTVGKIANNPSAIGIFGYSYLEENSEAIQGLPLDGIAPSAQSIADGSYPASRPLYIYVKKAHIGVTPGIEQYLEQWSKSWSAGSPLADIGLVPSTKAIQSKSAATIADQTTLSLADFETE